MIEAIARQYITGSMWRDYSKGEREICGIAIPEGLERDSKLPELIITPSTKGILKIPGVPEQDDVNVSFHEEAERRGCVLALVLVLALCAACQRVCWALVAQRALLPLPLAPSCLPSLLFMLPRIAHAQELGANLRSRACVCGVRGG